MSSGSVVLGLWDSAQYESVKIENFDLDSKVETLKNEAVKKLNAPKGTIGKHDTSVFLLFSIFHLLDLVYCGLVLEDDNYLTSYGIKPGVTIHVVKKNPPETAPRGRPLTEPEVQQLVVAFRAFTLSSGYRAALQVNYSH